MSTFERLRKAFAEALGIDEGEITPETRVAALFQGTRGPSEHPPSGTFVDQIPDDSLDFLEFTMLFEEALDIEVPEVDLDTWKRMFATATVQQLADFIDRKGRR